MSQFEFDKTGLPVMFQDTNSKLGAGYTSLPKLLAGLKTNNTATTNTPAATTNPIASLPTKGISFIEDFLPKFLDTLPSLGSSGSSSSSSSSSTGDYNSFKTSFGNRVLPLMPNLFSGLSLPGFDKLEGLFGTRLGGK